MIRERVSTHGVIRPLEPAEELDAFTVPYDAIGGVSELALRRYLKGRQYFDTKFASAAQRVERHRVRNLERSTKDTIKNMAVLQNSLETEGKKEAKQSDKPTIKEGLLATSGWSWAWAMDSLENPPPSSIVSRRDTEEARQLAKVADQSIMQEQSSLSGNSLWSVVMNFLTPRPEKGKSTDQDETVSVETKEVQTATT